MNNEQDNEWEELEEIAQSRVGEIVAGGLVSVAASSLLVAGAIVLGHTPEKVAAIVHQIQHQKHQK